MCFLIFNDHDVLNNWNYIYVKKMLKKMNLFDEYYVSLKNIINIQIV